jgi:hypothetical protein
MSRNRHARLAVWTLVGFALVASMFAWCIHPVCMPLSAADLTEAAKWASLETRTDRQLHGPIFQRRNGGWYQCKSWISRQFFF